MLSDKDKRIIKTYQECLDKLRPLIKRGATVMDVTPSETIYSDGDVIIPMVDVQHIERKYHSCDLLNGTKKGDFMGISIITRHTRWDMDADCWANNIWIGEKAEDFIKAWCYFRYEVDGTRNRSSFRCFYLISSTTHPSFYPDSPMILPIEKRVLVILLS